MTTIAHGAGDLIAVESVQVRDEVGQAVRAIQAVPDQQEKFVTELVLNLKLVLCNCWKLTADVKSKRQLFETKKNSRC